MLAIAAAIVFGIWLLLDLFDTNLGAPDLFNFSTMASLGLLLLSLYLAGVGSGQRESLRPSLPGLKAASNFSSGITPSTSACRNPAIIDTIKGSSR